MQKQAPSFGRIFIMAAFALSCFGLLLFLWLAFGGAVPLKPKGYRFTVPFREAGQLAQEADVRISGVTVGKVKVVATDKRTGSSNATIELQSQYAPIPQDANVQGVVRDTGAVFDALSERDGQLRGLIESSNRVFATTAKRNRELEETFKALPTFERESRTTVARLTRFAHDTNPLVTQLR